MNRRDLITGLFAAAVGLLLPPYRTKRVVGERTIGDDIDDHPEVFKKAFADFIRRNEKVKLSKKDIGNTLSYRQRLYAFNLYSGQHTKAEATELAYYNLACFGINDYNGKHVHLIAEPTRKDKTT